MRNQILDRQKLIAEIIVVFGHVNFPGILGQIILALARYTMPFFFLVTGYFCFSSDTNKLQTRIKKRIVWLLKVILVSCLLFSFWKICRFRFQPDAIRDWLLSFDLKEALLFIFCNYCSFIRGHLWYLFALLYLYIIMLAVLRFRLWRIAWYFIPVILAIQFILNEGAAAFGYMVPLALKQNFIIMAYPYFFLGYYIRTHEKKIIDLLPSRFMLVLIGTFGAVLTIISWLTLGSRVNYQSFIAYLGGNITGITLFLYAIKFGRSAKPSLTAQWGAKYLLYLYIVHPIFGDILEHITTFYLGSRITLWNYMVPPLTFLLTLGTGILFYQLLEKFTAAKTNR